MIGKEVNDFAPLRQSPGGRRTHSTPFFGRLDQKCSAVDAAHPDVTQSDIM
jgi:hypothetical protein